jgi:polyhydroxyalkanoate synthesis regulator phasin
METFKAKLLYDTRQIKRLHKKFLELEAAPSDDTMMTFLVELEGVKYTLKKNGLYSSMQKEDFDFHEKQREIDELQVQLQKRIAHKELEKEYDHVARQINKIYSRDHTQKNMELLKEEIAAFMSQIESVDEQIQRVSSLYQKMNLGLLEIEKELYIDRYVYFT